MKQLPQTQVWVRACSQQNLRNLLSVAVLLATILPSLGQNPGTQRWSLTAAWHIFSSPAISLDGTIYVGAGTDLDPSYSTGGLYSIAPDGATNWYLGFPKNVRSSPAVGPDGRIYVGCMNGELKIVDPTGNYQVVKLGATIPSSPAIGLDGTVYVGSLSNYWNKLHALTPDGATKWSVSLGNLASPTIPEQFSSPAIGSDGTIYVGSLDKNLYALSAAGTTNWIFPLATSTNPAASVTYSSPSIGSDGTIYIGADNGRLYAIAPSGTKKWEFAVNGIIESSAAIAEDGTIYAGSLDGNLYAINPDGSRKWAAQTGLLSASPAIAADGTVYVGSLSNQKLFAFDAAGSNLWSFTATIGTAAGLFSSPAIGADGTIYFGSGTGLFAVYGTSGPMPGRWPMFRGNLSHTARAIQRQIRKMQLLADNTCQIDLGIETGRTYKVEWSGNLVDWNTLTNLVSDTYTNQVFDTQARDWTQRYYRLSTAKP